MTIAGTMGQFLVVASQDKGLQVLDHLSLQPASTIPAFRDSTKITNGRCFAVDHPLACTNIVSHHASNDGLIQAFGLGKERSFFRSFGHHHQRSSAEGSKAPSPSPSSSSGLRCLARFGNEILAGGLEDGSVLIWSLPSGDIIRQVNLQVHLYPIQKIAFSSGGQRMLSLSRDKLVCCPRVEGSGREFVVMPHGNVPLVDFACSGLDDLGWSVDGEGGVCAWDLQDGACLARISIPLKEGEEVRGLAVNVLGTALYVACSRSIRLVTLSNPAPSNKQALMEFRGLEGIRGISLSPDQRILYAHSDSFITAWDCASRQVIKSVELSGAGRILGLAGVSFAPLALGVILPAFAQKLKRTAAENEVALGTLTCKSATAQSSSSSSTITMSIITRDCDDEPTWKARYEALTRDFSELESLNAQLCDALESAKIPQ